ncbi:MAG: hypothetical protein ACP6IY_11080 [Promethearchaeia archaeon]
MNQSEFIIKPLHELTDIVNEKKIPSNYFEEILEKLYSYFKNNKEHRTIYNVDEAFEELEPDIRKMEYEIIQEKEKACERVIEDLKNFTEKYNKEIKDLLNNAKTGFLVNYWIFAIQDSIKIISDFLNKFNRKSRKIDRKSKIIKIYLLDQLTDIFKGFFLVLFRIFEQIHMIVKGEDFIPDKEIDYLIEDLVYLKNLYRASLDALN